MKLNLKSLLVAVLTFLCGTSAMAYDFEYNGFYFDIKSLSDLTVSLTWSGQPSYSGDVVIPSTAEYAGKTFAVTEVDRRAFLGCSIGKLTVPESVIGGSIQTIGNGYNSERINKFYAADPNPSPSYEGMIDCLIIEDSDVPIQRLTIIGHLKTAYIGREHVGIAFDGNLFTTDIESVTFGEGVTKVCSSFYSCLNLTSVTMPNIVYIGGGTFERCKKLKEISGPKVETIDGGAFRDCASLESFSFPKLKKIGGDTFAGCAALKNVVLPSGLISMGEKLFRNCTNLESVSLPASLMKIEGGNAFAGCEKLTNITVCGKTPASITEDAFDLTTYFKATLCVPAGAKEAYQAADHWKNFFNIVEDASINDDVVSVLLDKASSWGGTFYIQSPKQTYRIGDEITIVFEPAEGCAVYEVLVNGVDMISQVVDNKLTFTLESSVIVSAHFDWQPADHYLTIKQGEKGCVKMKVDEWNEYSFVIEPDKNSKIHSVTYNGEDITDSVVRNEGQVSFYGFSADAVLIVAFESLSDGIRQTEVSRARVFGEDGAIRINGYADGESVSVYNVNGQLVHTKALSGTETVIPVESGQVYVVKLKGKSVKLAI